jgi:hypothetical protein
MSKDKITEKEIEKMGDYFNAIIAIAERGNDEYCSAIKTIALDANNFFYKTVTKDNN